MLDFLQSQELVVSSFRLIHPMCRADVVSFALVIKFTPQDLHPCDLHTKAVESPIGLSGREGIPRNLVCNMLNPVVTALEAGAYLLYFDSRGVLYLAPV